MSQYQFSKGIIPIPGTPAYEAMVRNVLNAQNVGEDKGALKGRAQDAVDTIFRNTGTNFGMVQPGFVSGPTKPGYGLSSSTSSRTSGPGGGSLLDEILSRIRSNPEKQFESARRRMGEDVGEARTQKMSDLARRGLFRAGVGEQEMQREIDKPYTRGLADLNAQMADANADLHMRGTGLLADLEAAQRQAAAQQMAQAAMTGTGSRTINPSNASAQNPTGSSLFGAGGGGGMFGAEFVANRNALRNQPAGGGSQFVRSGTTLTQNPEDQQWQQDWQDLAEQDAWNQIDLGGGGGGGGGAGGGGGVMGSVMQPSQQVAPQLRAGATGTLSNPTSGHNVLNIGGNMMGDFLNRARTAQSRALFDAGTVYRG